MEKEEEQITNIINDVQEEFPNLKLPSMGIIDNEKKIEINGKDYIDSKSNEEE